MPAIKLTNLTKTYANTSKPAVNHLNLEVNDGEFLCLLGPSGCGKTTILRMIAGIETISAGEITIDNTPVDSVEKGCFVPPEQRHIGLVFQSYALWPHMTVLENVSFGLKIKKVPMAEQQRRTQDVMEKLHIAQLASRYPAQLSGGQQQRVALARMLVLNPKVLLLDEPLSNLDAALRLEMRSELRRIHKAFGTTIIFVSHDQWEAMTLASTIAVMSDGQLQQVGPPNEIYTKPVNRFVAEFIGNPKLNLMPLHNIQSPLSAHLHQRFGQLQNFDCCAIRPEEIILSTTPQADALPMQISSIIPTGGSWIIELKNGEDQLHYSTQRHPQWQTQEQVFCQLPELALHFFTPTGSRQSLTKGQC
ncbi:ABC transporter ATP-binding protein [Celerinatantimonas diazotrophica]|uniref:Carbohydrate ABC transporter ATP-binding protein (CUT1 family) n=1 Tax=Celerinatantimonas diazotrophica TaxID=412034 RepID=A0A4R1J945_9GAMM|nr:ABC transporter ATP-binding protein [Celerinatantimonas diazotrophica]TCK47106.1 carbohydrate ABC transporter ATP-binding protein (CUT1 family) [Celerinatantimonas diazotrophica]CAG9295875.1 Maltose/maltodextrin import ATP-binding protein MalK [Celerinatantimonas diazotrophica]